MMRRDLGLLYFPFTFRARLLRRMVLLCEMITCTAPY